MFNFDQLALFGSSETGIVTALSCTACSWLLYRPWQSSGLLVTSVTFSAMFCYSSYPSACSVLFIGLQHMQFSFIFLYSGHINPMGLDFRSSIQNFPFPTFPCHRNISHNSKGYHTLLSSSSQKYHIQGIVGKYIACVSSAAIGRPSQPPRFPSKFLWNILM